MLFVLLLSLIVNKFVCATKIKVIAPAEAETEAPQFRFGELIDLGSTKAENVC